MYLVDLGNIGRQAAVDAKDFTINHGSNGEQVKHGGAVSPRIGVAILVLALVCEWSVRIFLSNIYIRGGLHMFIHSLITHR